MSLRQDTFEDELNRRCSWGASSPEYRVRWSPRRETFEIEQRTARGQYAIHPRIKRRNYDEWLRLRDGYTLVARVSPAQHFRCRQCNTRLAATECAFREIDCPTCRASKEHNNVQYFVAYWPLSESLLTHLERSHPSRLKQWMREMDAQNDATAAAARRDWSNHIEAGALEYRHHIAGNPRSNSLTNSID